MKNKKLVYIYSPYRGNIEKNTKDALGYCAAAFAAGYIPIAPHVYFTRWTDDNNKKERAAGLEAGKQLLLLCSEIWVFGLDKPTKGMQAEIATAVRNGIRVYDGEIRSGAASVTNEAARAAYKDILVATFSPLVDIIANAFAPIVQKIRSAALASEGGKK